MDGNAVRNLHVPLPEPLYRRLRTEAERTKRPATTLAREAIDEWLARVERAATYEAIARYAARYGGTAADLDLDLEAAAVEHLAGRRKRR